MGLLDHQNRTWITKTRIVRKNNLLPNVVVMVYMASLTTFYPYLQKETKLSFMLTNLMLLINLNKLTTSQQMWHKTESAFSSCAPLIWNKLAENWKSAETPSCFKLRLKCFLVRVIFDGTTSTLLLTFPAHCVLLFFLNHFHCL